MAALSYIPTRSLKPGDTLLVDASTVIVDGVEPDTRLDVIRG